MAGVVGRAGDGEEALGGAVDQGLVHVARAGYGEVEAAYDRRRGSGVYVEKSVDYVDNPPVRAARNQHSDVSLADEKVLFVPEFVGRDAVRAHQHVVGARVQLIAHNVRKQREALQRLAHRAGYDNPRLALEGGVDADVLLPLAGLIGVALIEGAGVDVDRGGRIRREEGCEAAAVVVVAVAEDAGLGLRDVDAEPLRVAEEGVRLPGVEEELVPGGLNLEAEAVLGAEAVEGAVVDEAGYLHACSSALTMAFTKGTASGRSGPIA